MTMRRTLAALPVIILAIVFLACAGAGPTGVPNGSLSPPTTAPGSAVTLAEFDQITPGMTYEQVVAIVGTDGKVTSEMSGGAGFNSKSYSWAGPGCCSNAIVSFTDGKVASKVQTGLT